MENNFQKYCFNSYVGGSCVTKKCFFFLHFLELSVSKYIWNGTIDLESESVSSRSFSLKKHLIWKHGRLCQPPSFQLDLGPGYFTYGFGLKGAGIQLNITWALGKSLGLRRYFIVYPSSRFNISTAHRHYSVMTTAKPFTGQGWWDSWVAKATSYNRRWLT